MPRLIYRTGRETKQLIDLKHIKQEIPLKKIIGGD